MSENDDQGVAQLGALNLGENVPGTEVEMESCSGKWSFFIRNFQNFLQKFWNFFLPVWFEADISKETTV